MRGIALLALVVTFGPGCLSPRHGGVADTLGSGSAADALDAEDATPPDTTADDAVTGVPCRQTALGATGVVSFYENWAHVTPVVLDGRALRGERARAGAEGVDFVTHDLLAGTERVVGPIDDLMMLVDGRDGAAMYVTFEGESQRLAVGYVGPDQPEPVALLERQGMLGDGPQLEPVPFTWTRPVRWVERGLAVWWETETPADEPWARYLRVRAVRSGSVFTVWEGEAGARGGLSLRNGRALWAHQFEGPVQLWLADLDDEVPTPRMLSDEGIQDYALTDDAVWWISGGYGGGRVLRLDLASDTISEVDPGPCLLLAGGETRVVTVCAEHDMVRRADFGLIAGARPVVLDGTHRTVLPVGGEADVTGPAPTGIALAGLRVAGGRVVWGEYPPIEYVPGVSCHPGPGDATLRLAELDAQGGVDAMHAVSPLAVGCWCCNDGGDVPAPDIRLTTEGLAWNFALTDPRDAPDDGVVPIGWLLFDASCQAP
ncbi:MAG: hypothetical protein EP329_03455 [Deltaproteobacteria bacterium]|nr:MAG: hypothetical protein EP329_03455 [Deltaproteobacteria bacterium]